MIIYPEFVPGEGWYTQGGRVPAPTVAELLRRLGPGAVAEGYYPGGYIAHRDSRTSMGVVRYVGPRTPRRVVMDRTARSCILADEPQRDVDAHQPRRMGPRGPQPGKRTVDWDRVLDLWANGQTADRIASRMGVSSVATVAQIVQISRKRGDPRAVRHKRSVVAPYPWDRERVGRVRSLARGGFSAAQVALRLNREFPGDRVTRNAVIGKLSRLGMTDGDQVEPGGPPYGQAPQDAPQDGDGGDLHAA